MTRVLIDVNVVLDAVLERAPHTRAAEKLWVAAETRRAEVLLPAHGVTTLFYLLARAKGAAPARRIVGSISVVFGIAAVDRTVIQRALALGWTDLEDAVCAAAAEAAGCEAIVTRDAKGFRRSPLPVLSPEAAAALVPGPPDRIAETTAAYGGKTLAKNPARSRGKLG